MASKPLWELCAVIEAPDFPTGGILVEDRENIIQAYETGKGSFCMGDDTLSEMPQTLYDHFNQ